MNKLSQEDKKDLHKKAKKTKKTLQANRYWKPLRILVIIFVVVFLCLSTAFLIYLSKTFYLFSNTDKFLCHRQADPIPAQYQYIKDNNLAEGEQKITKERESGMQRRCYSVFSSSYMIKEKDPVNGIIAYREKKQNKDATSQNTPSIPTASHINTYDSGHCYEKRLPYKTNVVYKVGYSDSDYTDPGFDGWEFICDGKVMTHISPMNATRTITTARPNQSMYYDAPKLKQPEIKPIESHICKNIDIHTVKCGK